MYDGHDNKRRSLDAKVDSKRKACHRRPSHIVVNDRISERMLDESVECGERFGEEFMPEAWALAFVPRRGCRQILIRLFPEPDGAQLQFLFYIRDHVFCQAPGIAVCLIGV